MELQVVKIQCPKCGKEAEAVRVHEKMIQKDFDKILGRQCFNCRFFEKLEFEEKTIKLF